MAGEERKGLLLALLGFAVLSIGDGIAKSMVSQWSPVAIATLRYVFALIGLMALMRTRARSEPLIPKAQKGWHFVRGLAVALGASAFFTALSLMPLAEATAITFTSPVLASLLAAVFLGEPIRQRTISATAIAFAGVILILKPNLAEAGLAALLPMVTASTTAIMIIGNRKTAGTGSGLAMQFYMVLIATPILLLPVLLGHFSGSSIFHVSVPDWTVVVRCAILATSASIGHFLIFRATTLAGAAVVAPMMYGQLLVAMLTGWFWFAELPDAIALSGAALIVAAGIVMLGILNLSTVAHWRRWARKVGMDA